MKNKTLTIIILAASLLLIAIGIIETQYQGIFSKAINICLECIGIG